ncbi:DNA repair protein [Candidatus Photodesmus katoptron]|uniref:DNA repair protein RadA n=1 Tax=Candidatus Photodesmus katoptron Akat1 TaxID=1236703 RepID=S3DH84_9GAMM|nr:DNA repair protein RadA [Candidatus Photodesmus katoptron]EPE37782.1 DNA repair protein RadA [Candidatus Photodesmus katoptron Akat1]KEY90497.1 DNA repair protein [Candidatus Photodesmus katoptron]
MKKIKLSYICSDCGTNFPRWHGHCNICGMWNTISEIKLAKPSNHSKQKSSSKTENKIQILSDINLHKLPRLKSGFKELDRVLGGGIVPGATILIGGNPGTGKSTLLLQMISMLSEKTTALYVTGEESLQQIAMRASRLKLHKKHLKMLSETNITKICEIAKKEQLQVMIIDSIQVMRITELQSSPGSITQVRESAMALTHYAKQNNVTVFIVGHVTKDGTLAGPKILEHIVDCSILLDSSADSRFRMLRSKKNRFGAINELGVFSMTSYGLQEVHNPSAIFLSKEKEDIPGSSIMVLWEGTRPLLIEVQALVNRAQANNPRRISVGLEQNRLSLLLTILHKHADLEIINQDVFVNVVGGVKITETSADLAILIALLSSFKNKSLPKDTIIFGEVGLAGEIRPVPSGQERLKEASKHGFKKAIIPSANVQKNTTYSLKTYSVKKLSEAIKIIDKL